MTAQPPNDLFSRSPPRVRPLFARKLERGSCHCLWPLSGVPPSSASLPSCPWITGHVFRCVSMPLASGPRVPVTTPFYVFGSCPSHHAFLRVWILSQSPRLSTCLDVVPVTTSLHVSGFCPSHHAFLSVCILSQSPRLSKCLDLVPVTTLF